MQQENEKPVCGFPDGTRVKIKDLTGCGGARSKLYAMGLTPGTELEILSSNGGPCRLRVRDSDVVIGKGLALKILACPVLGCPCKGACAEDESDRVCQRD